MEAKRNFQSEIHVIFVGGNLVSQGLVQGQEQRNVRGGKVSVVWWVDEDFLSHLLAVDVCDMGLALSYSKQVGPWFGRLR